MSAREGRTMAGRGFQRRGICLQPIRAGLADAGTVS